MRPWESRERARVCRVSVARALLFVALCTACGPAEEVIEVDADAVSDGESVWVAGIMEHIEEAGIHSGDSACALPAYSLPSKVLKEIERQAEALARALKVKGLMNVQFAVKGEDIYVLEANPRASRTVPFIAKAYGEPYVNYAAKIMLGQNKVTDFEFKPKLKGYAIKQPVFSFSKFPNVNKALGPEMKSTGESILFIDDLKDDQFYELYSRRKMYLSR